MKMEEHILLISESGSVFTTIFEVIYILFYINNFKYVSEEIATQNRF